MQRLSKRLALRYMTRFSCIGAACEDNCCWGWTVHVNEGTYVKLRRALGKHAEMRALLDASLIVQPREERTARRYAKLRLLPDGTCSMLDGDRLCSIHRHHGESLLPDVCFIYPRYLSQVGTRTEVTGILSCPEVARQALLAEDATDIVEVPPRALPREIIGQKVEGELEIRHLDEVRGSMYQLLGLDTFPLSTRLYFQACLAEAASGLIDAQGGGIDQDLLESYTRSFGEAAVQSSLAARLKADEPDPAGALALVFEVLNTHFQEHAKPQLVALIRRLIESYAAEAGAGVRITLGNVETNLEDLAAAYLRRREVVCKSLGERIDLYFQNYGKHYWMKEWYGKSPSLLAHTQQLLLCVSIMRFLLIGHPRAQAAARMGAEAGRAELDRLAVEVVYAFSRTLDHTPECTKGLTESASRLTGLEDSVLLLAL